MYLEQIASYWNLRADGYSDSIHEELAGKEKENYGTFLKEALPNGENLRCLDIGCGPGFFSILLASMGHRVVSADYSPEMLEYTRRNCIEAGVTTEVVRADAQHLPFEDETFDFICSRNLVWNLEDPEQAYKEWLRVLKPGGRVFVWDGNYYLHYFDEDYKNARDYAQKIRSSEHHTMKGVDPTPIDTIARDLPLSKIVRPDWDEMTLTKLGGEIRKLERFTHTFIDEETGEEKSLVYSFLIHAEKCSRNSESAENQSE